MIARLFWALCAGALAVCSTAGFAADLAKSGKYTGKFGWYSVGKGFEMEQNHLFWVGEFSGAFFNDKSGGFMDLASVVCPGSNDVFLDGKAGDAKGYCIMTDKQGDKAYLVWKCNGSFPGPCNGDFQWTGGTGKYSGIKGNNKFYGVTIAPTASGYSVWEGGWELP
jgi:hypothetical protein